MARAPILAAGGIVMRGGSRPLIAVVQRRKDDGWVLPKGKLKKKESAIAAARREAVEETGHNVFVREFLGAISYKAGGTPKVVQFWRMQAVGGPARELMRDIKAVEWLPLQSAIRRLDLPLEQLFLRNVGRRALELMEPAVRKKPTFLKKPAVRKKPMVLEEPAVLDVPAAHNEPAVVMQLPVRIEAPSRLEPPIRANLLQRILQRFRPESAGRARRRPSGLGAALAQIYFDGKAVKTSNRAR
jgi:8-oxo-dGTP diphosphatase